MAERAVFMNGQSVGSGETKKRELELRDPDSAEVDNVNIIATRSSTAYNVKLIWCDSDFNELETETVGSNVSGGTQHTSSNTIRSPYCKVAIEDNGSSSGSVDLTAFVE